GTPPAAYRLGGAHPDRGAHRGAGRGRSLQPGHRRRPDAVTPDRADPRVQHPDQARLRVAGRDRPRGRDARALAGDARALAGSAYPPWRPGPSEAADATAGVPALGGASAGCRVTHTQRLRWQLRAGNALADVVPAEPPVPACRTHPPPRAALAITTRPARSGTPSRAAGGSAARYRRGSRPRGPRPRRAGRVPVPARAARPGSRW